MNCSNCGREIDDNTICPYCGESNNQKEDNIISEKEYTAETQQDIPEIDYEEQKEPKTISENDVFQNSDNNTNMDDAEESIQTDISERNTKKSKKKLIIPLITVAVLIIVAGIIGAVKYIPYSILTDEEKAIMKRTSKGYTLIKDGESAETDFVEISFSKAYVSKEIEAIKAKSDNEDEAYIYIEGKIKNIGTSEYTVKGIDSEIIVDSLYTYKSTVHSDSDIKPNGEYDIIIYASVPYATFNDFEYVEFKYAFNNNLENIEGKSGKKHYRFSSIFEEKDIWNAVEPERNPYIIEKLQEADALIEKEEYEKAYYLLRDLPSSENIDKKKLDCEEKIIAHDYGDYESVNGDYTIIMSLMGTVGQDIVNDKFWGEYINEAILVIYKDNATGKYLPLHIRIGVAQSIYEGWIFADIIKITDGEKTVYINVKYSDRTSKTVKYKGTNILSESYNVELTEDQVNDLAEIYKSDKVTYILSGQQKKEISIDKSIIESDRWTIEKAQILSTYD